MTLDERLRAILPPHLYEAPPPFVPRRLPVTYLEADRPGLLASRRRADCTRLEECELEWFRRRGEEQAKCPASCSAFELMTLPGRAA